MLLQLHLESPRLHIYPEPAPRKSVINRALQRFVVANLKNGLQGRGQVCAVVIQNRCERPYLGGPAPARSCPF